jgi:dienelactone hydrolase
VPTTSFTIFTSTAGEEPQVSVVEPPGHLARFASMGSGRVSAGDMDCFVTARDDPRDGSRHPCLYIHSAQNDWALPARSGVVGISYYFFVLGTRAMVRTVFDYVLETGRCSIISTEASHTGGGGRPSNGWGNDEQTAKLEANVDYAHAAPPNGLGAAGKILGCGYSHGGPSILNLVRTNPTAFAGVIIFAGAVGLTAFRAAELAFDGTSDINAAYSTCPHNPSVGSQPDDTDWEAIKVVHDPVFIDWDAIPDRPPVLLVHGDLDDIAPLAQAQLFAAAYGPRCQMIVIEGTGHGFGLDFELTPEAYAPQIHSFIDGLDWD